MLFKRVNPEETKMIEMNTNCELGKYIQFIRKPYEEPYHLNLIIRASNGKQLGELEFYDNAESLLKCAETLEVFPRHNSDMFLWELGSERPEDKFAFYFRFRVFLINSTGRCAIQIRLNNNSDIPDKAISEFVIEAEPAGVNRLGKAFRAFSKLQSNILNWNGIGGEVA